MIRILLNSLRGTILFIGLLGACAAAAGVPEPVLTERPLPRNRLNLLVLGATSLQPVAQALQITLADEALVYFAAAASTAEGTAALTGKKWSAVYFDFASPTENSAGLIEAIRAVGAIPLAGAALTGRPNLRPAEVARQITAEWHRSLLARGGAYAVLPAAEKRDPALLLADPAMLRDPSQLHEAVGERSLIYRAEAGQWQFNLHSFIAYNGGKFWVIWSSGRIDEDSSSQVLRYATSPDGHHWSESTLLTPDPDGEQGPQRWMASGLYVEDGRLYALGSLNEGNRSGEVWANPSVVRFEWKDEQWQRKDVYAPGGVIYYPPLRLAGNDFVVWRDAAAGFFTALAQHGTDRWTVRQIPGPFPPYRLSETSHYVDADGVVHLIIRDQGGSGFLYHSVSFDSGATWTVPACTNFPDALSKNFAGRLNNGWFYLTNNPRNHGPDRRDPLAISFSRDGWTFRDPVALLAHGPELRFPGKAKDGRSFQYSHAIEHDGQLWVVYAINKEDIEVAAFPLAQFHLDP
jgi:hypothetical protein